MRYVPAITFIAVISLGALSISYKSGLIGDGHYELTVRVRSASGAKINTVTCEAFQSLAWAQLNCADSVPPQSGCYSVEKDPFAGEDLKLQIPFSEYIRTPLIGSPYVANEHQYNGLLVLATMENGKRFFTAVAIPHRKDARAVTVDVP